MNRQTLNKQKGGVGSGTSWGKIGIFSKQDVSASQITNSILLILMPEWYKAKIHKFLAEDGNYSILLHKMEIFWNSIFRKHLVSLDLVFT